MEIYLDYWKKKVEFFCKILDKYIVAQYSMYIIENGGNKMDLKNEMFKSVEGLIKDGMDIFNDFELAIKYAKDNSMASKYIFQEVIKNYVETLRKEAEAWLEKNGPSGIMGQFPNRSCWNCNGSHEHLKKADFPIDCFECGHIYFKGVRLTE